VTDPYRDDEQRAELPRPRPLRRGLRRFVIPALAAIGGTVIAVLGAPVAPAFVVAGMVGTGIHLALSEGRRRRLVAELDALPFPVRHSRASALELWWRDRSPIRSAELRFAAPLDGVVAERIASDVMARVPGLAVVTAADAITLERWQWRGDDLLLLAALLETWGREVHVAHPVAEVFVAWSAGGPSTSF
jgi:hypothetical protein